MCCGPNKSRLFIECSSNHIIFVMRFRREQFATKINLLMQVCKMRRLLVEWVVFCGFSNFSLCLLNKHNIEIYCRDY